MQECWDDFITYKCPGETKEEKKILRIKLLEYFDHFSQFDLNVLEIRYLCRYYINKLRKGEIEMVKINPTNMGHK
tara:strand:- start:550 stop:774 length:225 start_codon:yes stop_codon:yes gene_type:complete